MRTRPGDTPEFGAHSSTLGHDIARNTVKAILKERGIEPAPERGRRKSWHTFIKSHLGAIGGADFFTGKDFEVLN